MQQRLLRRESARAPEVVAIRGERRALVWCDEEYPHGLLSVGKLLPPLANPNPKI